jgi:hypothetical protein
LDVALIPPKLVDSLADRYRLEGELGAGGMATELVTEVTARLMSLKRHVPRNILLSLRGGPVRGRRSNLGHARLLRPLRGLAMTKRDLGVIDV